MLMCKWCQEKTEQGDFCSLECREKFRNLLEKRIRRLQRKSELGQLDGNDKHRLQNYILSHDYLMSEEV